MGVVTGSGSNWGDRGLGSLKYLKVPTLVLSTVLLYAFITTIALSLLPSETHPSRLVLASARTYACALLPPPAVTVPTLAAEPAAAIISSIRARAPALSFLTASRIKFAALYVSFSTPVPFQYVFPSSTGRFHRSIRRKRTKNPIRRRQTTC